jgi:hypothetical protein
MKIVFKFENNALRKTLIELTGRIHRHIHFDRVSFILGNSSGFEISGKNLDIFIDGNISDCVDILRIDVLKNIFLADLKMKSHETGHDFLDGMIISNRIMKHGWVDDLFVYNLYKIRSSRVSNLEDFLRISSFYVVFHGQDKHDYDFLKSLIDFSKIDKDIVDRSSDLVDMMHNNLSLDSVHEVAKIYDRIISGSNIG